MQCGWSTTEGRMKHMRLSNLKGKRHRYPVPARSGREPFGEPMFEEEAGNGDTGISVPSLARAMTKDGETTKLGCRHLDKNKTREARARDKHRARSNKKWLEPKWLRMRKTQNELCRSHLTMCSPSTGSFLLSRNQSMSLRS